MAQRKQKTSQSTPPLPPQLAAVNLHAAGMDIGAEGHFVAVPPSDAPQPVRGFGAYTIKSMVLGLYKLNSAIERGTKPCSSLGKPYHCTST